VRTPTWAEIEEFCQKDGWEHVRSTSHSFFRKILPDGTVLETHTSFADDKTMSPGRFAAILRRQLQVTADEFWETLRAGRPAIRRGNQEPPIAPAKPSWIVAVLQRDVGLTDSEIAALDDGTAQTLVEEFWSRRKP
jgi:hypothetical protein